MTFRLLYLGIWKVNHYILIYRDRGLEAEASSDILGTEGAPAFDPFASSCNGKSINAKNTLAFGFHRYDFTPVTFPLCIDKNPLKQLRSTHLP